MGYTTESSNSGMGLSFVKNIAEEHKWDYSTAESEEGGARFEFKTTDITNES